VSKVEVPIHVRSSRPGQSYSTGRPEVAEAAPFVADLEPEDHETIIYDQGRRVPVKAPDARPKAPTSKHVPPEMISELNRSGDDARMWRDRALRLQAEMENYRKRQERLSEERALGDRERLLRAFLDVADNLARALDADGPESNNALREGVQLTYRSLMNILDREGVTSIDALGQPFDPRLHEAIGTVPASPASGAPQTIVNVVQRGYMFHDRLLRPARVVVTA